MVYAASTLALAVVEILVHVDEVPSNFVAIRIDIPESIKIDSVSSRRLPPNWRAHPAPSHLATIGTAWAQRLSSVALAVPSAVIPQEQNLLINPLHPDARTLVLHKPVRFAFDARLKRRR
jgi:RES domain-containing protein